MKILIAEDNHDISDSLRQGLQQIGHTVDTTYDGPSSYDYALENQYDAIILDWMLPELDGIQIIKQLRQLHITTPILMLTAKGELDDKILGLDTGADDYLPKPFAFRELVSRLNSITRRPPTYTNDHLNCGQLTIDLQTKQVTIADQTIDLTKKEFGLLEFLLRHKNQVISAEQIIKAVWSFDDDVLPNTAQVYIGYLRNKIDKPFQTNYIQTVRGFGYKLNCKQP